jgi:hypothetical protein
VAKKEAEKREAKKQKGPYMLGLMIGDSMESHHHWSDWTAEHPQSIVNKSEKGFVHFRILG